MHPQACGRQSGGTKKNEKMSDSAKRQLGRSMRGAAGETCKSHASRAANSQERDRKAVLHV